MRKGLVPAIERDLREPLLHFVVAGLALVAIYGELHGPSENTESRDVRADDVRRIECIF